MIDYLFYVPLKNFSMIDVTITREGLENIAPRAFLCREGSLKCHTYCDTA
jgi:hypothetical protein